MTKEELLIVLSGFNGVFLKAEKGEMEIEPQMSIIVKKDGSDYRTEVSGYTIKYGGRTKYLKPKKLLKFIEKHKAVKGVSVKLIGIGHDKISYDQYIADNDFDKIDMAGLLDKYGDIANAFSLTCPYGNTYYISEELAEIAQKEITLWCRQAAKRQVKNSDGLPPFEKLYAEIEKEYETYYKEREEFAKEHDGHVFFCDAFAEGKTEHKEPQELWHVYHNAEFAGMCVRRLEEMKNSVKSRDLCEEIKGEEVLIQNLEDIKVSFTWHCTTSGELSKTFFFTLNEETKKWLLQHKNDYDFKILQDLTFYNGSDILFSSCTHGGYHIDLSKK